MNKQIPTTEALDEQERELARILRALPGGEPPAALDARILKAAGNAAAASRRPRARWLASGGAMWAIGSAAAAVLALGVSWQLMYPEQRATRSDVAPAARMQDMAEDSTISVGLEDRQASEADAAPAPSPAKSSALPEPAQNAYQAAPSAPPPPAPASTAPPEAFADERQELQVAGSADTGASAETAPLPAEVAGRSEAVSSAALAAPAAKAAAESQMSQRAAAAADAPAITSGSGPMKPANWLAHIRRLLDEDRAAEAKASLLEFQKSYPDFVIPSDLAPLLRE